MKKIKITVLRKTCHRDLMEQYENPIEHACDLYEGQVFTTDGWRKPDGLCDSAWQTLSPFVMTLAHGGTNIYDGWMKNPASAMISPVIGSTTGAASIWPAMRLRRPSFLLNL